MGTIIKRCRKNGTIAWLAQISVMRQGKVLLRESQTFERRSTAAAWIENREETLARPGALDALKAQPKSKKTPTLGDAIDRYVRERHKQIGRTKTQVLKSIKTFDIADMHCEAITSADIVAFAQEKLDTGVQPQTVANYMSHLAAVFSIARPAWGYPLHTQAMEDARKVSDRLGITGKSQERDRRPTLDELDQLMQHFLDRSKRRPTSIPMHRIIAFAIFSTRRQEEIIRISWDDLDADGQRILVRDMKNPGEKIGNDVWCDLDEHALAIIQAMPRQVEQIFPYSTDAISAAFTRACKLLEITNLHFHDLRHDGVSRLFELGLNIPYVAANSGHRSWTSLKRYTHLRQTGDKYTDWRWLPEVVRLDNTIKPVKNGQYPRRRRSERGI